MDRNCDQNPSEHSISLRYRTVETSKLSGINSQSTWTIFHTNFGRNWKTNSRFDLRSQIPAAPMSTISILSICVAQWRHSCGWFPPTFCDVQESHSGRQLAPKYVCSIRGMRCRIKYSIQEIHDRGVQLSSICPMLLDRLGFAVWIRSTPYCAETALL